MRKAYWIGAIVFLGITIGLLYMPTLGWLWDEWFKRGIRFYSHGPLVVLISLFLIWRSRALFASAHPSLVYVPLVLMALGVTIIVPSQRLPLLYTYSISAYALLLLILGVLLVTCGRTVTRHLLFPVLFLALAIPAPFTGQLASFLAKIVAAGSAALADAVGITVVREGTLVTVGGYTYSVAPLCSSLNMMLALFTLVLPILYLKRFSMVRSALFLLATPVAALAFKILLVTSIFWMTRNGGQEAAMSAYHGWAGMLAFGLGLSAILLPLLSFRRPHRRSTSPATALSNS